MKVFSDPCGEIRKAAEHISVSGDQFTMAVIDVSESAESVDFQLKDELVGIERLSAAGELDWTHPAWQYGWIIAKREVDG